MLKDKRNAGFTIIELCIVMLIIWILFMLGWRFWRRPMIQANETVAVSDLRSMHQGALGYYIGGRFFPPLPICLAVVLPCGSQPPGCPCVPEGEPFVDPALAEAIGPTTPRAGYVRQWIPGPALATGNAGFCYEAAPEVLGQTGARSFGIDASGRLGVANGQVACCAGDGTLNTTACPAMR